MARMLLPLPVRRRLRQALLEKNTTHLQNSSADATSRVLPSQAEVDIYTTKVVFSIEKACRILGYDPKISFAEGMEYTSAWIKWGRL
jgi:nucleoside-diphosphate-sugar epimerase